MKTACTLAVSAAILTFVIISCQKSDVERSTSKTEDTEVTVNSQPAVRLENGSLLSSSGVTITAPEQVNVDETLNITAAITCGRVAIERGYILGAGNTKIYKDLTCSTALLQWEELVTFQCYDDDASWSGSFDEAGTYVFRTKHNGSDGNCDGLGGQNNNGECSFNGVEFCCFVIEAVDACETSYTGEVNSCATEGRTATFTFTSKEAVDYFKIQGGLTNFTGGDAIVDVDVTGGTFEEPEQSTPGGSSNRVITIKGSLGACETITIKITWNSTNPGGVITGSWSVKDANGVELAPAVEELTCAN